MRKILIFLAVLMVLAPASGQVFHEIQSDEDSAQVNTTIRLSCEDDGDQCPVNRWKLSWNLPEDAEIISIRDSLGEIDDYRKTGQQLSITSNSGDRRRSETIEIVMDIQRPAEEINKGLYKREFSLSGFRGGRTSGYLRNDNIISGWTGYGFQPVFRDDNMTFRGQGSSRFRINFGEGNETEYYEFFGGNPKNTSLAYEIAVGMTGLIQDFDRFPVALMSEEKYENSVVGWSSGEYVGGSFRMRKGLGDEFLPVLAHETVHGLNDRKLNWDQTSSTWFDEGTSKYVESMTELKLDGRDRARNLFGEDVSYTERRNGTRYRITLPSKGDRESLWDYYERDGDFMKYWNPSGYPDSRSFGYAYSELVIKNYVAHQGGSLDELYDKIDPGRKINSSDEKWNFYSQELDTTPCKYEDRERFEDCLDEINNYEYKVYRAVSPEKNIQDSGIEPIDVPNKTEEKEGNVIDLGKNSTPLNDSGIYRKTVETDGFQRVISTLNSIIDYFFSLIRSLFG